MVTFFSASNLMPSPNYFAAVFKCFCLRSSIALLDSLKYRYWRYRCFFPTHLLLLLQSSIEGHDFWLKTHTKSFLFPLFLSQHSNGIRDFHLKSWNLWFFNGADISWAITFFQFPSYALFAKTNLAEWFGFLFNSMVFFFVGNICNRNFKSSNLMVYGF